MSYKMESLAKLTGVEIEQEFVVGKNELVKVHRITNDRIEFRSIPSLEWQESNISVNRLLTAYIRFYPWAPIIDEGYHVPSLESNTKYLVNTDSVEDRKNIELGIASRTQEGSKQKMDKIEEFCVDTFK